MKSPFPGMNPYLEQHWRDVHHRLITYASDELQAGLPGDLRARVEERVFVESAQGVERSVYPDIRVIEKGRPGQPAAAMASEVAVAEPLVLHLADEPVSEGFIEIIDAGSGNRVVTVIEFLSLSNKLPGEGRKLYRKKQRECKEGGVSLVEIDLLRAGRWVLVAPAERIPASHRTTYQVCVRRSWQPTAVEIYRVPLRERLPIIRIPLRETDPDARLDLQTLIDQCYRNGRYDDLDYTVEPNPPLDPADAAWADAWLREQGRR
jgi:hypothetical protein